MKNSGVICSPRNTQPKRDPTIGCAKKVKEATPASSVAKAVFQRYMAKAVEMMSINSDPSMAPSVIIPIPMEEGSRAETGIVSEWQAADEHDQITSKHIGAKGDHTEPHRI